MKKRENIVEVEDLTVAYQSKPVLWDLDLGIIEGSRTAIIGPNGAGKSTLMIAILDMIPTISGSVQIYGKPYEHGDPRIAYIPQYSSVNWDFPTTVEDVVLMGRYVHLGWIKRPKEEDRKLALQALEEMGMEEYRDRQISQLSGGQKQRVFIARAICQDADLYFMDEPLAGVDIKTENLIMKKLKEFQAEGKTSIVVHHDLNTVKKYFDRVVLLNKTLIAEGPVDEVLTDENLKLTYRDREREVK